MKCDDCIRQVRAKPLTPLSEMEKNGFFNCEKQNSSIHMSGVLERNCENFLPKVKVANESQ